MLTTTRILTGAFLATAPILLVLGLVMFESDPFAVPPPLPVVVVVVWTVGIVLLLRIMGYRFASAGPSWTPAQAATAFSTTTTVRAALCESVVLISLALGLVATHGGLVVLALGAVCSMVLLVLYVWPGDRVIQRFDRALSAQGVRKGTLRQGLGLPDERLGITEL